MAKLTKRQKLMAEKVEAGKLYPLEEAVSLLKEFSTVKFAETVDAAINLGIDPRKSDQAVRGATSLPHGTGKDVRVAVFTSGANADAAVNWAWEAVPLLGAGPEAPLWVSLAVADWMVKLALALIALVPFRVLVTKLSPNPA